MKRIGFRLVFLLIILSVMTLGANSGFVASKNSEGQTNQTPDQKVRVQIQIVADSSNFLQANLEAPVGAPARDLMDRLFKMSYVDATHRFVNGIAGFVVSPREKKFWRLEVDGKASDVGIAEIKINKSMQIRWEIAEVK